MDLFDIWYEETCVSHLLVAISISAELISEVHLPVAFGCVS